MNAKGFTLIELMIAVAVIAIMASIAYPNYTQFLLKNNESLVQTRLLELSQALEKHKSKNFSYKGFPISAEEVGDPKKYTITIVGSVSNSGGTETITQLTSSGSGWIMKAIPEDARNYTYLFNSSGAKCRNKLASKVTYLTCGGASDGKEDW